MNTLKLDFVIRARDLGMISTVGKATSSTAALGRSIRSTVPATKAMTSSSDAAGEAASRFDQANRKQERSLSSLFRSLAGVAPVTNQVAAASARAGREIDHQAQSTAKANAPTKHLTTSLGGLFRALGRVGSVPGVGDKQASSMDRARRSSMQFATDLGRTVGGAMITGTLGIGALVGSVIATGAKFEQYETVLTGLEKSSDKAKRSMDWVRTFARTTPYELDQTMEAFIGLKRFGIDPMDGSLRSLGDASAGTGKHLMAAVEMLADAQMGEFERLKEFGIRASAVGKSVRLTYVQAGKDVTVTADKSASAIRKAVLGIFDSTFKGAMVAQSKTFNGLMSSMKDSWTDFNKAISDAGVFALVKSELEGLSAKMNSEAGKRTLQRWAGDIGKALAGLFRSLRDVVTAVNWPAFIAGVGGGIKEIGRFAKGVGDFVGAVGGIGNVINGVVLVGIGSLVASLAGLTAGLITSTVAAFGLSVALSPIIGGVYLVGAAIGVVAGLAFLLWRNWGAFSGWFKGMWTGLTSWISTQVGKIGAFFSGMWTRAKAAFDFGIKAIWAAMPPWLKMALTGAGMVVKLGVNVVRGLTDQRVAQAAPPRIVGPWATTPALPGTPRARAGYVQNRAREALAAPIAPRMAAPRATVLGVGGIAQQAKPQPVAGRIEIAVSQEGPPRVRSVRTNQPDFALALARGPVSYGG